MSGGFFNLFGPPMTPEERAIAIKEAAEANLAFKRKESAGLEVLKEAQAMLREAAALGMNGERLERAQKHLAIYVEQVETELVRP